MRNRPSKRSRVGAFWVLPDGSVTGEAVTLADASFDGSYYNGPSGHQDLWPGSTRLATLRGRAYTTVPRGRVVLRASDGVFLVFAAPEIVASKVSRQAVERHFGLAHEPAGVRWAVDEHYATQPDLFDEADDFASD